MTVTVEKLNQVNADVSKWVPYDPGTDSMRHDVVITVGQYQTFHFTGSVIQDHVYEKIEVHPSRREASVHVYLLSTDRVAGTDRFSFALLGWPYYWLRSGKHGWVLLFPAMTKMAITPVKGIPPVPRRAPAVKTGPKATLDPRDYSLHLRKTRAAQRRKAKGKRLHSRFSGPFHRASRINPETILWNRWIANWNSWDGWTESPLVQTPRYYRYFTGTVTPGFKRKHRGELPVNNYSLAMAKCEDPMGLDIRLADNQTDTTYSYQPSSLFVSKPLAPNHDDLAYNKALMKLIDHAEIGLNANIAQDLAQYGQVVNMIGDSARRIAAALHHVKAKRYASAWEVLHSPSAASRGLGYRVSGEPLIKGIKPSKRTVVGKVDVPLSTGVHIPLDAGISPLKSVAENWLALQYGWKPLLMDIDGAMRSLANYMVQAPQVVRTVKGSGKSMTRYAVPENLTSDFTQKVGEMKVTTYSGCTIGIRYSVDSAARSFLAQTGFTNPVNLAWEVLPYSFVVDWFLPIGPYLETLSAFDGLAFVDGYVSKLTTQYTQSYRDYTGLAPQWTYRPKVHVTMKSRYWREYIIVSRAKLFSFPSAIMPSFKNPFSVTHALNGLSLLRAAFR